MTIRIEINPNLRVDGGECTIADLDEDVYEGEPRPLAPVIVFESASGMVGRGWIASIDDEHREVRLVVDWASLKFPEGTTVENDRRQVGNLTAWPTSLTYLHSTI